MLSLQNWAALLKTKRFLHEWKVFCRSLEVYSCYDRLDQENQTQHNQQQRTNTNEISIISPLNSKQNKAFN